MNERLQQNLELRPHRFAGSARMAGSVSPRGHQASTSRRPGENGLSCS